eukprot:TRINITY_DN7486_c0_g1_i2.p1 TRINITY_DN7486_c0_g1~~TRINITY_DN7486_c0_g1_i2.p1  ORF type:complete len:240 (-),score=47.53 TRINITY_DN7486_c0_g1_i2:40-657(-)
MSKKRGLSADEKRIKLKEFFIETKDVFTLKQLETTAAKQKGIVAQSIPDVLKSLVDDNIVKSDKIGSGNYYWCFPSDESNAKNVRIQALTGEIETLKRKRDQLLQDKTEATKGRDASEERTAKLAKLAALKTENAKFKKQLADLADNNPELMEAMKRDTKIAKDAANRWTDNIFSLKSHITNNFGVDGESFSNSFGVPSNLDYLE